MNIAEIILIHLIPSWIIKILIFSSPILVFSLLTHIRRASINKSNNQDIQIPILSNINYSILPSNLISI